MRFSLTSKISVVWMFVTICCCSVAASNAKTRATSALASNFETVFYSDAGLFSGSGAYKNLPKQSSDSLRVPFASLLAAVESLPRNSSREMLSDAGSVLVGARDFRAPAGLGGVRSQFCYVIILRPGTTFELEKYLAGLSKTVAGGVQVWNWSAELGEFGENDRRPSSLYVAQVGELYILISNNMEGLRTTYSQLRSPQEGLSKPVSSGWEFVGEREYWGYRRYRHEKITDKEASGITDITSSAQVLLFSVDFQKDFGVLRLLASDSTAAEKLNAATANSKGALPVLRKTTHGAWEAKVGLLGDQKSADQMFELMSLFGFGIYL